MIKRFLTLLCAGTMAFVPLFITSSCSDKETKYNFDDFDPDDPDDPSGKPTEKPRYIWVDAAANFPDFANSKENIARDLALAKDAGFTDIVVDVRPTNGDVLFRTDKVNQVAWLGAWLPGGFTKIDRTATWDYLDAFIEAGHKLGLKVHAAINTMVGGNTSALGSQGLLFRDAAKKSWATTLNTTSGLTNTMDASAVTTKFFNPVNTEVQDFLCSLLKDLAAYPNLDGIFLDRGRFDGFDSDFSAYTRQKFEAYIGSTVTNFPNDIIAPGTPTTPLPSPLPLHFKRWLEFRAKTIHDFMEKARTAVKSVNSDMKFGVYVGGWYSTYYDVGVNWASPTYNTSGKYTWATTAYQNFGYADLMDHMLIGAYAAPDKVFGSSEWTMEGFCKVAKQLTMGACKMVAGGPDVGNWDANDKFTPEQENAAITNSVVPCINAGDGYFLFDMIHLKKQNQWQYAKKGINDYLETLK